MRVDLKNQICELLEIHNHLPMVEIGLAGTEDVSERILLKKTKRGGTYYILDGHKFTKCAQKGVTVRFRCTNYTEKCKCRLLVYDEKVIVSNVHNHD
jgi:hypothetical protein